MREGANIRRFRVLPGDVDSDLKKSVITGGTVEYLAPEVLDKQIMGKAQDIWAIG